GLAVRALPRFGRRLCLLALLSLLIGATDGARHRLADSETRAKADAGRGRVTAASLVAGCVADRLGGLVLRVGRHVADRPHAGALVDPLLDLLGRRHCTNLEGDQVEPESREVVREGGA